MKQLFFFTVIILMCNNGYAQCDEAYLATTGNWKAVKVESRVPSADGLNRTRFLELVHSMFQSYKPSRLEARPYFSMANTHNGEPVNLFGYAIMAHEYWCDGNRPTSIGETGTRLDVMFNQFLETPLYDTSKDNMLTGFFDLRHGMPVEIKPGIWKFPSESESLGMGIKGESKLWLITFDNELPWTYVTRKEFLVKRKSILQYQLSLTEGHLKEQLEKWEYEKKYKQDELKNDPAKLAKYIDNTYKPGIDREHENYKRSVNDLQKAIERVDDQLTEAGLEKQAIVIKDPHSLWDYNFTDKVEPFAEVLTKPNPAYFKRKLAPAVPQFISVELTCNYSYPIYAAFGDAIEPLINLDLLKSFIGKTVPGATPVKSTVAAPKETTAATAVSSAPVKKITTETAVKKSSNTTDAASVNTTSAKATGKGYTLSGTISAPAGAAVTLASIGTTDLPINFPKTAGKQYSNMPFAFTKPIAENAPFDLMLKKIPANMKGVVYNGKGTAANGVDKLRAAVDYTYELVSRSTDDKTISGFYESGDIAIGGYNGEEGRYVAFVSLTAGLEGNNGKYRQIFWRDRNTGVTKLISKSASGELANADSYAPSLSADGQLLVFESNASNLVDGDNNNANDIFIWNAATNTIELVSKAANGKFADAESYEANISGNGQFVVFTSNAANLSSTSKGQSISNVFIRDLANAKTEMISIDPSTGKGGSAGKGSISFDGSRATFSSATGTLVRGDTNNMWDIFLWQRGEKGLKRISLTHDGKERNQGQESATRFVASSISGNGRYIAYTTTATNVVPNDNNVFQDVFVYDTETNMVTIVSQTDDGKPADNDSPIEQGEKVAISYDGTWIAFPTKATNLGTPASNIVLHNIRTGKKQIISNVQGTYVGKPAISYSGSYVLFAKASPLDSRFSSSGIFAHFTGNGPCRDCKE